MSDVILTETRGRVGIIRLNRPQALNALNTELMEAVVGAVQNYDTDENIAAIVLTGNEKAFAAGADIKEMKDKSFQEMYAGKFFGDWEKFSAVRTPIIAAVNGYCFGGGCEVAMMCDTIVAGPSTVFGQPEINLGVIPGMGGSQRLTRAIGKAKAMDMVLTGRNMKADEAERLGLVGRLVETDEEVFETAVSMAETIGTKSFPSVMVAKESVNAVFDSTLTQGLKFERALFQSLFSTEDQKEGMEAFAAKRTPEFKDR